MSEEDEIKKKMMEKKLFEMQSSALQEHAQMQQLQESVKKITAQILDHKARERLANLKTVKPDLAFQIEVYLSQLYQMGQLKSKITEQQLIMILKKINEQKEFRIKRAHK
ncbi:MAG: DNA-binding protein [Candidatus Aenigmarchaeota archaeon]|nr:DNA-binding protein [Candidatus Aenigmarchaeota archaeon]